MDAKYVAALDVGTTTIRCFIYNNRAEIIGKSTDKVILHYPHAGYVEINPEEIWSSIISVLKGSLADAGINAGQLTSLGISTQRGTFTTWRRGTTTTLHNFITWKDLRANKLVTQWNDSLTLKGLRFGSLLLYMLTRSKRFQAGSVLKLMNTQTTPRLMWALQNIPELKKAVNDGSAMFGTLDTWLLYRLTGCQVHLSDASSASATGFYDPFQLRWAGWALSLFHIPSSMLPKVVPTAGKHFGMVSESILGYQVPITCSMADQSASMWGSMAWHSGSAKLTLGTGAFINVNTGYSATSSSLLYPLVGWQLPPDSRRSNPTTVYLVEAAHNDAGTLIDWAEAVGLIADASSSASIAESVTDSGGVCFVPANGTGAAGWVGVLPQTTSPHLLRALLESIAMRCVELIKASEECVGSKLQMLRVDGGVSQNDFIIQLISDMCSLKVERPQDIDMSSRGVAYLAGLYSGLWQSQSEISPLWKSGRIFNPRPGVAEKYAPLFARWQSAVDRLAGWHRIADPSSLNNNSIHCTDS